MVSVDDSEFYTGKVNTASYVADADTTEENWDTTGASEVYFWIPTTPATHTIVIASDDSEDNEEYTATYTNNAWTLQPVEM